MSECLYPTLIADGSLTTPAADNCSTLQRQITSEIDKYLQEATEKHERDDNYYDGWHVATNTSSPQQEANLLEQDDDASSDVEDNKASVLESHGQDTGTHYRSPPGHNIQLQDELETILEEEEEEDEPQTEEKQDIVNQDTVVFTPDESEEEPFNTAIGDTSDDPTIVMGKPVTTAFISDDIRIPTEKVGCLQVTSQLQEFLNHFPPESIEKVCEQIYQILQVLDAYLIYIIYTSSPQQEANLLEQDDDASSDVEDNKASVLESHGQDTGTHYRSPPGHNIQLQDELETILEEEEEEDEPQTEEKQDIVNQDTVVFTPDESEEEPFNTAIGDTSDDPTIVMGKPVTTAFISDDIRIPTEKVGCLQVTSQLQEFLNHFPPESIEKVCEQIYQILQVLDAYLIYIPQQHQYCM